MKILYDISCQNPDCDAFDVVREIFKGINDEYPACTICAEPVEQYYGDSNQSVHFKGGKNAGWTDDGRLGRTKDLRRVIKK